MTLRAAWLPFMSSQRVASVRLRTYNPVSMLQATGTEVRVLRGGAPAPDEVLVLQKAYGPEHLELARRHRAAGGSVVLDLCDNHFASDEKTPELVKRSQQLRETLEHVDVVSVCTDELGELVPHPTVLTVNDALDPPAARPRVRRVAQRIGRRPRVLWFGTAGAHGLPFGIRDLARALPALGRASQVQPFELVVMSNSRAAFSDLHARDVLPTRYLPWTRRGFDLMAAVCDVAVLPVEINEVTRGKSSNRVATAFQHGLAVVTDPLPSYQAFSECVRFGDYESGVVEYLASHALRSSHVDRGRQLVEQMYADDVIVDQWATVIRAAASARS